ncbi:CPP1-like family protein [Salsipaludibacter albus]|uniref:CPP1-like family protein n=1 Tax=Salsipaludibacter albus TaxID=2849650 RepID=UPI001EE4C9BF|nr:CPP1-like family protein [Salsipaludibacter albus]MBY5163024.1 CPP1-like family protein [Salsipaludibacter albus]
MTTEGPRDDAAHEPTPWLPWPDDHRRFGRALGASTAGAVAGSLLGGPLVGWIAEGIEGSGGWSALAAVLVGAALGVAVCASIAQWIAFADEYRRARRISALVTSLGTIAAFPLVLVAVEPLQLDWLPPPLLLAMTLLVATIVGRVLAWR